MAARRACCSARSCFSAASRFYAALGALIHLRNLPSIVVTLGMSFVWQGLAILLLPKPGGKAPGWLLAIMGVKPPFVPFPIVAAVIIAGVAWFVLMRTSYGAILRGSGGNAVAIERAGWSLLKAKAALFALAGLFGVLSGMALVGITTSADANIGNGYTLLSIAGVILGGGEFVGGKGLADRSGGRRPDHGDGGLAAAHFHAHSAGLAGRRQRGDPDHRARRAGRHQPRGGAMTNALAARPWIWSFLGAGIVWLAAVDFTGGHGAGGMLTAALSLAVFTVIVGVGQMFVITLGPGNVDLSLPANIGLASAVAMKTMGGDDSLVALGLLAALGCGLAVGVANYLLIRLLRIPPIIATLSASFIIQSIDISYGRGLQIKPPPGFADFTNIIILGVPLLAVLARCRHLRGACGASPNDLGPLGAGDRTEHPCGPPGGDQGRAGAVRHLRALRGARRSRRRPARRLLPRRQRRHRQRISPRLDRRCRHRRHIGLGGQG